MLTSGCFDQLRPSAMHFSTGLCRQAMSNSQKASRSGHRLRRSSGVTSRVGLGVCCGAVLLFPGRPLLARGEAHMSRHAVSILRLKETGSHGWRPDARCCFICFFNYYVQALHECSKRTDMCVFWKLYLRAVAPMRNPQTSITSTSPNSLFCLIMFSIRLPQLERTLF